jgi:15-cis-phytoene synthase
MHYWSWLFAAPDARESLLGLYALTAEWRALTDPSTDLKVAEIKLAWWRDELQRLAAGSPAHPITRHLAQLPRANTVNFISLESSLQAALTQMSGVPLERAAELQPHADALYGTPLWIASQMAIDEVDDGPLQVCTSALAAGLYRARAAADYGREARAGRLPFPVDELLAAGIDNDDLAAPTPPPRLADYLAEQSRMAASHFAAAAAALPTARRPKLRHLAVLASLGRKYQNDHRSPTSGDFRLGDLYNAWNAARRAAATHD